MRPGAGLREAQRVAEANGKTLVRCGDSPLMGHGGRLPFPRELRRGGGGIRCGGTTQGNRRGSGAEDSLIWAEPRAGALAGAQTREPVLGRAGSGGACAPPPRRCQPHHSSERGPVQPGGREGDTLASGMTTAWCLGPVQLPRGLWRQYFAQCGLGGAACSPVTTGRSLDVLDLHFLG